ncbi:glycoside hydrolase family 2 protein [Parenemella sanctibonifatiensis]|uniref:Beta-galactosidase n=1 Tax=Parenemella sanctibonifatiensis TaxID=2016505 RepID=A0A255E7L3_9ACTN|nr:sugar-binding domain-containing protein [Parenemella sanctibonifatiensis]OYN87516.1 beta-galactosidase [Parenemella sanctibonifatiensis]
MTHDAGSDQRAADQHAAAASPDQPRPEYPRPQLVRERWLNLNGRWQFSFDSGDSGEERGLRTAELDRDILVPFCPESTASGIGDVDFHEAVWYRREVSFPADWDQRILLHFGAVDHDATVWVNDVEVARHRGGFSSFSADITAALRRTPGQDTAATIVVRARDSRHQPQARGKQATWYANSSCNYTRTTGIWQTVWAEPVSEHHLGRPHIIPELGDPAFTVQVPVSTNAAGLVVRARLRDQAGVISQAEALADADRTPTLRLPIPADRVRLWRPGHGELYDIDLTLIDDGEVVDEVASYAGLRSVTLVGDRFLINGEPVFQRLVLDQGYWPDSLMTAPSDEAMVHDIELALEAGFNGARLHQKVFEERFLHHADRMGYLVWGEFGDWGVSGRGPRGDNQEPTASFITQWLEVLERDRSHPAIVGWCPLNETHQVMHDRITVLDDVTQGMYLATKLADTTRPVLDASGYSHRVRDTEIWDNHSYEQDPAAFAEQQGGLAEGKPYENRADDGAAYGYPYQGQPMFCSEYGGIWWNPEAAAAARGNDSAHSWGYGQRVADEEEFHARFAGLTQVLSGNPQMFGYCYTQLTDVFQEENGIYRFDRSRKLDVARVRQAQSDVAAYEKRTE